MARRDDIWFWTYTLRPLGRLSALATSAVRSGALIRVGGGFADVHPWPELGDASLQDQLAMLSRGQLTPLTQRSLELARIDGAARGRGHSLFRDLSVPPSHWTLTSSREAESVPDDFITIKVKMPGELPSSMARYKLRLDFNATLTADEFLAFAAGLSGELRQAIDFVEDPCPYDASAWQRIKDETGLRLALDRGSAEESVDVHVVKPAVQEWPRTRKEIVVTSYMDHPVGQLGAAYTASVNGSRVSTCGLLTHVLYEPNEFSERLAIDGDRLVPPSGSGVGFDDLLEALPWKKLA